MELTIAIARRNEFTKNYYFGTFFRSTRAIVLTLVLPLLMNFSLSGCTQSDTIAPESEIHSAAREATSVLSNDSFEDKKWASFWGAELHTATAGAVTKEQHRVGKQAMRFSWKPAQVDGTNTMLHSELATTAIGVGEVAERWYGFSTFLPSASMANDTKEVAVAQWHGVPDAGQEHTVPPVAFTVLPNNNFQVTYRASSKAIVKSGQAPTSQKMISLGATNFDRWVDYVVHVKWDATGKTGLLQVWKDGELVINEQGISIGYPELRQPYWKVGLYCWTGESKYSEKVMYYDETRIGDATANYDAVKPGRGDNSAKAQR